MKASHTDHKQLVGMKMVDLKPGQFVFGRSKAASELNLSESTVWRYMKLLEKLDSIALKSNNKFTVVTIGKWGDYQSHDTEGGQQMDNKWTTKEQQMDTNKNVKKSSSSSELQNVIDFYHQNLQIGVSSSPYVYQQIEHWVNDLSDELVLAAMKLSAKKEKKGFDYTEGILKRWVEANVQSLEDARKHEKSFKQGPRRGALKKPLSKEDFDLSE
jgi:DnaD/phage-associated family protein